MTLGPVMAWDYTRLADAYDRRADYHAGLVARTIDAMDMAPGTLALEVGAGTGKLTGLLCRPGLEVLATEPNARMRDIALGKPALRTGVRWVACRGEALPLRAASAGLVAYGSSFNVLPVRAALDECARVLAPGGYWMALWNHRDLDDPLQREVEALIRRRLPAYDYGRRRASPEPDVAAHGAFGTVRADAQRFVIEMPAADWLQAWQSHATLERQAGSSLPHILEGIRALVGDARMLQVPYITRVWTARRVAA